MTSWCRKCRTWVYDDHFLQPNGRRDGCGQGAKRGRYHPGNPKCGDVWRVGPRAFVVDFVDSFYTDLTFEDGEQRSYGYTDAYTRMLQEGRAELVSTFEEWPCIPCDHYGWSRPEHRPPGDPKEHSIRVLKRVLAAKEKDREQRD